MLASIVTAAQHIYGRKISTSGAGRIGRIRSFRATKMHVTRTSRSTMSGPWDPMVALPHSPGDVQTGERGRRYRHRPGRDRLVHKREERRLSRRRGGAPGAHGGARCAAVLVIPATQDIYRQAMVEGLFETFLAAHAAISTPTCGPCVGGIWVCSQKGKGRCRPQTATSSAGWDTRSEIYLPTPPSLLRAR